MLVKSRATPSISRPHQRRFRFQGQLKSSQPSSHLISSRLDSTVPHGEPQHLGKSSTDSTADRENVGRTDAGDGRSDIMGVRWRAGESGTFVHLHWAVDTSHYYSLPACLPTPG